MSIHVSVISHAFIAERGSSGRSSERGHSHGSCSSLADGREGAATAADQFTIARKGRECNGSSPDTPYGARSDGAITPRHFSSQSKGISDCDASYGVRDSHPPLPRWNQAEKKGDQKIEGSQSGGKAWPDLISSTASTHESAISNITYNDKVSGDPSGFLVSASGRDECLTPARVAESARNHVLMGNAGTSMVSASAEQVNLPAISHDADDHTESSAAACREAWGNLQSVLMRSSGNGAHRSNASAPTNTIGSNASMPTRTIGSDAVSCNNGDGDGDGIGMAAAAEVFLREVSEECSSVLGIVEEDLEFYRLCYLPRSIGCVKLPTDKSGMIHLGVMVRNSELNLHCIEELVIRKDRAEQESEIYRLQIAQKTRDYEELRSKYEKLTDEVLQLRAMLSRATQLRKESEKATELLRLEFEKLVKNLLVDHCLDGDLGT